MNSQKGNVLVLILVAIALLAGLTYAVTGNKGGSQGAVGQERARIQASRIVAYLNSLKNGTNLLVTGNKCREEELDFSTTDWLTIAGAATTAANGSARAGGACALFDAKGGGQTVEIFANAVTAEYASTPTTALAAGHGMVGIARVEQAGSDLSDVVVVIGGLDLEVCRQIQKQAGITEASTTTKLNTDCFTFGSSTTDYAYTPSAGYQLGEVGTLTGNKLVTGICNTAQSGNPVAPSANACFVASVLMER